MSIRIIPLGGFNEVGKNMVAIDLGEDVILLDGGFYLPAIVALQETERVYSEKKFRSIGAIPDDTILDKLGLRDKVRAIIPSHAHLDHIGALPYIANRYNADIIATPFTIEVLKSLLYDEKIQLKNKLIPIQPNGSYYVQGKNRKYKVDFINITHSTPQSAFLAIHTPDGIVAYSNDFKLDNNPILGLKPNYQKMEEIAKEGIKVLICDSLYAGDDRKTASEKVARTMLEDVLLNTENRDKGLLVTTFSSHIARLKSIVDFGKKLDRKIIFMGRSLAKYTKAANKVNICPFIKDVEIATYRRQLEKKLKTVQKSRGEYMIVCTGHQGEPGSILDRMARNKLHYQFNNQDHVIFSSSTIPTEITIENRAALDTRLKKKKVRMFTNVHVSGHAGREDLRDFINILNPQHIIPAHGPHEKTQPLIDLGKELGYKPKFLHLTSNGEKLVFN
ncbi:ribonuclease J [Candidatus Pacearchaeota archaeon]|nr:ribonuclease J [Candidatus Pacearchaeota archaeon]|tara:strand:+ start:13225 stop:14565 length:1341 start_codon:yes stop_codon:yes gene_type:complete